MSIPKTIVKRGKVLHRYATGSSARSVSRLMLVIGPGKTFDVRKVGNKFAGYAKAGFSRRS